MVGQLIVYAVMDYNTPFMSNEIRVGILRGQSEFGGQSPRL